MHIIQTYSDSTCLCMSPSVILQTSRHVQKDLGGEFLMNMGGGEGAHAAGLQVERVSFALNAPLHSTRTLSRVKSPAKATYTVHSIPSFMGTNQPVAEGVGWRLPQQCPQTHLVLRWRVLSTSFLNTNSSDVSAHRKGEEAQAIRPLTEKAAMCHLLAQHSRQHGLPPCPQAARPPCSHRKWLHSHMPLAAS